MSKLITNTIRHTGGSADNITLDNSQNVTVEGNTYITGTKKLGIGTTSPGDSLHIKNADAFIMVDRTSNEAGISLRVGDSNSTRSNIATQTNGDLAIDTANTERLRVLAGGGLTFNGDTAAANALDDYEEGTYNPTWVGITNYGSGYNDWSYTKIGRLVNILGTLRLNTTVNDGTDVSFTLPFTPAAQTNAGNTGKISVGQVMHNNVQTGSNGLCTYVYGGNAYGYFYKLVEDSSWTILEANDLSLDDTIYVNFTYIT